MLVRTIRSHDSDNVVIALEAIRPGDTTVAGKEGEIAAVTEIPIYHKIAVRDIPKGQPVVRYGSSIGLATQDIKKGEHVHVHNIDSITFMANA